MARRRTQGGLRWTDLLLLAGVASCSTLSLSSIEPTGDNLPGLCTLAYETPLRGCRSRDFSDGNTCSVRCRLYIEKAEFNIQATCSGVSAATDSLLHKAQKGQLLDALCKDNEPETTTKTKVVPHPTKTKDEHTQKPTTVEPATTTDEKTTTSTTTTSKKEAKSTESETTISTKIEPSTVETTIAEPTKTSVESSDSPQTTTEAPVLSTGDIEPAASTSTAQPENGLGDNPNAGSGGGSPGDFISKAESMQFPPALWSFVVAATGLGLAL